MVRERSIAAAIVVLGLLAACTSSPVVTPPVEKPDTGRVFKKTTVSWSDGRFQEVDYDEANQPTRYTNLHSKTEGGLTKDVHELVYSGKQLMRVDNLTTGGYVLYYYENNRVSRTKQFGPGDKWVLTQQYGYYTNGRLHRIYQMADIGAGPEKPLETRQTFTYDPKGNLALVLQASKEPVAGDYRDLWGWRYAAYDQHKNIATLWSVLPVLLPSVTLQVNNPGSVTWYGLNLDGSERVIQHTNYSYSYNAKGYAVSHIETTATSTQRATYGYED